MSTTEKNKAGRAGWNTSLNSVFAEDLTEKTDLE